MKLFCLVRNAIEKKLEALKWAEFPNFEEFISSEILGDDNVPTPCKIGRNNIFDRFCPYFTRAHIVPPRKNPKMTQTGLFYA